VKYFR